MGLNRADPNKNDALQGVEPQGEAVSADADVSLLNEVLFVHKYFIRAFFAVTFPILTIVVVYNLLAGQLIVVVIACCFGILLLWSYFLMCKSGDKSMAPAKQYRIYQYDIRGFLLIFLIYITYTIGWKGELDRVLWSYFFPIAAIIGLGKREGICWMAFFIASMALLLFYPRPYAFSPDAFLGFKLRYLLSFSVMCAVAFAGKSGIEAAYTRLIHRQGQLTESEKQYRKAYEGLQREMEERRQAQQALVESEERLRDILFSIADWVWEVDENGVYTYSSRKGFDLFGESRGDIIGKTPFDFMPPDEAKRVTAIFSDIMAKKAPIRDLENLNITRNGKKICLLTNGLPILDKGGNLKGYRGVDKDITDRKRAEEVVRNAAREWSASFDAMLDGVSIHDTDHTVLRVNRTFCRMLGKRQEELVGKKCYAIFHGTENPIANCPIERTRKTLQAEHAEFFEPVLDKWLYVSSEPVLDDSGQLIRIVHTVCDITDHKRAEEEKRSVEERLQRAEKMESLGILAGGVAHDLNNVLGGIFVYTELLLEMIPEESPLRTYLEDILLSGEKSAAIIQDLLTLARRGVMVQEVVNVNGIVSGFFKTPVFERIESRHPRVTFRKELSEELLNIKGSPVHLEKTVMNLLSNAAEAISGDGEITIRTENRYLDWPVHSYDTVKEGEYVVLTVSDTGKGISTADIGKIFEPFFTKKMMGRSGTGLGLAIVWGTVKDHGGYIDVQSEAGKGSVFTLYFPVTREEAAEKKDKIPVEQYMGHGESILVVDDTAVQREIATRMLTRLNYRVEAVSGGEEAVEYLKAQKADLLVLDMIMDPGIDGLETYARVLEVSPRQKTIIVSGFSESARVKKTQDLGAGIYVMKPYLMEKIGVAVRDELRKV
jgi:two-component system, cell cycle sensor histidine kinase and response regulator CckA